MRKKNKKKKSRLILVFILLFGVLYFLYTEIDFDVGQGEHQTTEITTDNNDSMLAASVKSKLEKANVYIQTNYQDGYEFGSGVIVHEDDTHYYAITNEHIIDGNDYVIDSHEVITNDEVSSSFEIIAQSEDIDLALIKFTKTNREVIEPLSIQGSSMSINDLVVSVGNPAGDIATITYGYIESITELKELELTHQVYKHNATLFNGSSGGALVDLSGNIIGINTWTLNGSFYAIRSSVINNFLINNL